MNVYILKRLLLLIPTTIGITLVCFFLMQLLPGGPVEELIMKVQSSASAKGISSQISIEQLDQIKAYYGYDQPPFMRYVSWMKNVLCLDLGRSSSYEMPAWDVIVSKMPISAFFGLSSLILSYLICVPLGVWKAKNNGKISDLISSIVVFAGYVIPSYALGILCVVFFAGGTFFDWFPLGGIVSDDFESLDFLGQIYDFSYHMILPLFCFMAGELAFLTLLVKNGVLDELKKDYVRTATLKGASESRVLWRHALVNALVPLATRAGEIFTVMFAGSLLLEKVFDIDGMGLLYYNAMISRDYNVVLGIIVISSFLALLGRLFADLLVAWIDPRVQY